MDVRMLKAAAILLAGLLLGCDVRFNGEADFDVSLF